MVSRFPSRNTYLSIILIIVIVTIIFMVFVIIIIVILVIIIIIILIKLTFVIINAGEDSKPTPVNLLVGQWLKAEVRFIFIFLPTDPTPNISVGSQHHHHA